MGCTKTLPLPLLVNKKHLFFLILLPLCAFYLKIAFKDLDSEVRMDFFTEWFFCI